MAPRGSIAAAVTRLITNVCLTTRLAQAKAASVAALSPISSTKQILSGHSSQTRGAPGLGASAVEVTAGSGSKSTCINSAASIPCALDSATHKAQEAPDQRAPRARGG